MLTVSNGSVLEFITIMAESVTAINRAALLKRTEPPIPMKTWIYVCSPVSSVTQKKWNDTYKIRAIVERAINHFKINMCIAGRKTRNHTTTKSDVFLASIASQLTVIVAYLINCPQYIRSLKPLIA